jgi:hypothetical protein
MRKFLLLAALIALCASARAADWSGGWRFDGTLCGGHACTSQELSIGAFQRWTIATKLRVAGTRVCGLYQTEGAKKSDHLLLGEIKDGKVYAFTGQDTAADPAFYERDDYARVPPFKPQQLLLLTLRGSQLQVQAMRNRRTPMPEHWTLARLSAQRTNAIFFPALPWQTQFLQACLDHGNAAIEAAARQLRALASQPGP